MRFVLLFSVVAAFGLCLCGCSRQYSYRYQYQYRAGSTYEYNQLMEAYDFKSGNLPPLPPLNDEPGEGEWVRVAVREEPVIVYEEYDYGPDRTVYVVERPYYGYSPRTYAGSSFMYGGRRSHRRSSVSVGFGFGSSHWGHSPFGYGHGYGHFDDGFHCWP